MKLLPGSLLALLMVAMLFAPSCQAQAAAAGGAQAGTPVSQSPETSKQEANENDEFLHSPAVQKLGAMIGLNAEQAARLDKMREELEAQIKKQFHKILNGPAILDLAL